MRDADYAIAAVMLGIGAIIWVLGWIFGSLRGPLAIVQLIVIRICLGLCFGIVTPQAVLAGGFWLLIGSVAGLLALFSFGVAAGFVWLGPAED